MTNNEILNAYVGDTQVEKIYLGTDEVWSGSEPGPEEPCAGMEVEIADCEGRGGIWDYVNCLCTEPPTCEETCAGDPECECYCQGGMWNGEICETPDPCGGDPECECYQQGPDWSWNGEECIYTEPV